MFHNPLPDTSAAKLSCILRGPVVASEEEGSDVVVGVGLLLVAASAEAGPKVSMMSP
jgi:hypothetical protein